VLRTVCDRPTLWEVLLPAEALVMPPELPAVDRLLDDPRFFEPFRPHFSVWWGRPSYSDRNVSAVDVLEVPVPAWLRDGVRGGDGLVDVVAVRAVVVAGLLTAINIPALASKAATSDSSRGPLARKLVEM
jgi:hypothetical protein